MTESKRKTVFYSSKSALIALMLAWHSCYLCVRNAMVWMLNLQEEFTSGSGNLCVDSNVVPPQFPNVTVDSDEMPKVARGPQWNPGWFLGGFCPTNTLRPRLQHAHPSFSRSWTLRSWSSRSLLRTTRCCLFGILSRATPRLRSM